MAVPVNVAYGWSRMDRRRAEQALLGNRSAWQSDCEVQAGLMESGRYVTVAQNSNR